MACIKDKGDSTVIKEGLVLVLMRQHVTYFTLCFESSQVSHKKVGTTFLEWIYID